MNNFLIGYVQYDKVPRKIVYVENNIFGMDPIDTLDSLKRFEPYPLVADDLIHVEMRGN